MKIGEVSKSASSGAHRRASQSRWVPQFLAGVKSTVPVAGLTHNFYRYPARFSPQFARAAIEAFTKPGDVVLDPFMGGGTTLVEASSSGRHVIGSDINSLAVFLARVKTTPLLERELIQIQDWVNNVIQNLNLHLPPIPAEHWRRAGYQNNLPWTIRKLIELALARIHELPHQRQQRFARCLLLRTGQWAVDCRERIPSAVEFRQALLHFLPSFIKGMREYRESVQSNRLTGLQKLICLACHRAAANLQNEPALAQLPKKPSLVLTSPPYPGVHILYHRWNVRGRRESPAPFWVADCLDGSGASYYTFGDRKQPDLRRYFEELRRSYNGLRRLVDTNALVVQMLAFSEPNWQLPKFLESMKEAGFEEVSPQSLGLGISSRLWRRVPRRRWFALIKGRLSTSTELVLFHRPC